MLRSLQRKYFGEWRSSWDSDFRLLSRILRAAGSSPDSNLYYFYISFTTFCIYSFFPIYSAVTESDMSLRFSSMIVVFTALGTFVKVYTLNTQSRNLQEMKNTINNIYTFEQNEGNADCREVGSKYRNYGRNLITWLYGLYIPFAIIFLFNPVIMGRKWALPLHGPIIGLPLRSHPGYEINYICLVIYLIYCAAYYTGVDFYFFLLCIYIVSRFDICKRHSAYIGDKTSEYNTEEKQKELMRYLVTTHTESTKFLSQIDKFYKLPILCNIFFCCGMLVAALTRMKTIIEYGAFAGFIVGLTQISIYSIFGEIISFKNEEFVAAIYDSKWYELSDTSTRKAVLLILRKAQAFGGLSIGGVYPLSLQTFTQIMKTCYFFAAFLLNMDW